MLLTKNSPSIKDDKIRLSVSSHYLATTYTGSSRKTTPYS